MTTMTTPRRNNSRTTESVTYAQAKELIKWFKVKTFGGRTVLHAWLRGGAESGIFAGEDFEIVFSGGEHGEHSVWASVSSAKRIQAHWDGYCESNQHWVSKMSTIYG